MLALPPHSPTPVQPTHPPTPLHPSTTVTQKASTGKSSSSSSSSGAAAGAPVSLLGESVKRGPNGLIEGKEYYVSTLPLEEKYALARSVGEECIQEEELRALLDKKPHPIVYDGFEPSGRMHIAQGVMRAINVNKLTKCGCVFKFWVADWFALLNNKMGGDLKKIQTVGKYMIEIWRAVGMDMRNVVRMFVCVCVGMGDSLVTCLPTQGKSTTHPGFPSSSPPIHPPTHLIGVPVGLGRNQRPLQRVLVAGDGDCQAEQPGPDTTLLHHHGSERHR